MENEKLKNYLKTTLETISNKRKYIETLNNLPKINIKGFSKDFFIDKPINILFQYNHQLINMENEKVYLSLFEKTTNFNKQPVDTNTNLIGNLLVLNADFTIINSLSCLVFVIFYDHNQSMKTYTFQHKGNLLTTTISCPENAVSFRIAIKLEGTGQFQNNHLQIEQKFELVNKNRNELAPVLKNSLISIQDRVNQFKKALKNYKYYRKTTTNDLKIAAILDEFSFDCFKFDCDLFALSKDHWKEEIDDFKPDFLLVESSWQGNKGEWQYEVAKLHVNKHRQQIRNLTSYCKENQIKTVFWDKEGLENFEFFKETASYFDYIFTADENNIDNFKSYTNNDKVFVLPFAAQPQIHNPINKNRNYLGELAFAGSYYNNKHSLRKTDIENLVYPSLKYGIQIFDRYFGKDLKKFPNNQWPDEYKANIVGQLNYSEMVEAYKNFDMFINVNSVQNSKFMFARRVYELIASRTLVISGPSLGVQEMFNQYIPISKSKAETEDLLKMYLKNPHLRQKLEKQGARFVYLNHTYKHRLQTICNTIQLKKNLVTEPKVTIISSTNRDEFMINLYENIKHQTYENIEAVIILNKNSMDVSKWSKQFATLDKVIKMIQVDENQSLGHCLNEAVSHSTGKIIAKFDDDDYYAPNYLTDMVLSMEYSNSDIVGKSSHFLFFEETNLLGIKTIGSGVETYTDFVAGATLVFTRDLFAKLNGFADKSRGEDSDFLLKAKEQGSIIYSNDEFNYCCIRRANKSEHTWKIADEELLKNCKSYMFTTDYKTPVTL